MDAVESEELEAVPAPQLRALDVALYRADPTDRPPDMVDGEQTVYAVEGASAL
jgi:hypothetical protein